MAQPDKYTFRTMAQLQHMTFRIDPRSWGPWRLNASDYTLELRGEDEYDVDLEECGTSAEVLDWIAQVASKSWGTKYVVGGLVSALDDVLRLQDNLCPYGRSKQLTRTQIRALVDGFAQEHREVVA